MKQLMLAYKRRIGWGKRVVDVPERCKEMTSRQFLAYIRLSKGWITEEDFFVKFFDIPKRLLAKLDAYQLYQMAELLQVLQGNKELAHFDFYIQKLPGKLLPPSEMLSGVSLQQFMTVDTFYSWYLVYDREDFLNKMVASLYLRKLESFVPKGNEKALNLAKRTGEVAKLPFDIRYAIMVNWAMVKEWLSRTYVHLFPTAPPDPDHFEAQKKRPADWLAIFDAFVGDNIADMDAYKQMPCMDAFRILNRKIKESKK